MTSTGSENLKRCFTSKWSPPQYYMLKTRKYEQAIKGSTIEFRKTDLS